MNRISILGAGESGVGAALLGQSKGLEVFVSDGGRIIDPFRDELVQHGINFEENHHTESLVLDADYVIKSPGVPDTAAVVLAVREAGIPVISELEFSYRFCQGEIISVTGTNGKTTTSLLIHHLMAEGGLDVGLAGNVGYSFARKLYEGHNKLYVLEVSSFQWDGMVNYKSDLGILLNITPDHLDRYNNELQAYVNSKFTILHNMEASGCLIYFQDDRIIAREIKERQIEPLLFAISLAEPVENGAFLRGNELVFRIGGDQSVESTISVDVLNLRGQHNLVNVMAAVLAGLIRGLKVDSMAENMGSFQNAPHRLELVEQIKNVRYVNDSKATNVDSAYYALEAYQRPIVWIAGGIDKGNDYDSLKGLALKNVKALICLGKDNTKLKLAFQHVIGNIHETESMSKAVELAESLAEPGDVVLLSPACASFDLFRNYEHRGNSFKEEVKAAKQRLEGNKILML